MPVTAAAIVVVDDDDNGDGGVSVGGGGGGRPGGGGRSGNDADHDVVEIVEAEPAGVTAWRLLAKESARR